MVTKSRLRTSQSGTKTLSIWTTSNDPVEWREEIDNEIAARELKDESLLVLIYTNGMASF